MLWRNLTKKLRCGTQIQDTSQPQIQAFNSTKQIITWCFAHCSNTLKWLEIVHWITLPITSVVLLLTRLFLSYANTVILWIFQLKALCPIANLQEASQLPISHCADVMPWQDGCSKIRIGGGNGSGTLDGEQWVIIWSILHIIWVSFWWFVYCTTKLVIFKLDGLCEEFTMLGLIIEVIVFGKAIVAAIELIILQLGNWLFRIITPQMLSWKISKLWTCVRSLQWYFLSTEVNDQSHYVLVTGQWNLRSTIHVRIMTSGWRDQRSLQTCRLH
jgi:hypothetical protein